MFGLFKKKPPETHMRKGVEIDEMRESVFGFLLKIKDEGDGIRNVRIINDVNDINFQYRGLEICAPSFHNVSSLALRVTIPEANILRSTDVSEKARLYRCIDHICFNAPGSRARYDLETGELVVGIESAGFEEQFRADTLIDIALYMLENAVHEAKTYLGLPTTKPEPVQVDQWDGGYHFGEGIRTYPSARDAFAAYMIKHSDCQEVSRDEQSILLQSGPIQYDVRGFGWPNAYMVTTATRGFKHIYHDDERYVRVQERLNQPIVNPERPDEEGRSFRSARSSTILYFQPDGTFVIGQYGFGNIRTDENKEAFRRVDAAHTADVYYMTYLADELPEELYSDDANRPN